MSIEENMRLIKTLDDARNSQNWDTFEERHADNVVYFGQASLNQQGRSKINWSGFSSFRKETTSPGYSFENLNFSTYSCRKIVGP